MIVEVKLWGKTVGFVMWNKEKELAFFQYDSSFLRRGWEISPLMMPLKESRKETIYEFPQNRTACFNGLPGLIADCLPDKFGTEIINDWFAANGLPDEEITPLDRLCYVGKRGMGALEFEPSKKFADLEASSELHIAELTRLADSIFKNRSSFRDSLYQENKHIIDILKVGTSAGGAKPKAIIAYNEATGEVRSGQVKAPEGFTYWLLKFDGTSYSEHGKISDNPRGIGNIEYAYYMMAKSAGINMMDSKLLVEGDYSHFMTKRFDRTDDGTKLHVQTLAAMAHYDRDTRHSYEEVFGIMRKLGIGYQQTEDFYRRMVFNVVARNHDDHTKNHSFIMNAKGEWTLAPAYDLCYSYSPSGRWTKRHQMYLNGKGENFKFEDLIQVGEKVGINKAGEIIKDVVDVVSSWRTIANDCGVRKEHIDFIENNMLLLRPVPRIEIDDRLSNENNVEM